jgi:aspartyl-tRNA(Asn)/glutamyl-tRNA(Gln) amidotransferase subunit A
MPVPDYLAALNGSIAGMRFGVEREHGLASVDPAIATLFEEAVDVLKSLGADVEDIVIPRYDIYRTASTAISGVEKFIYHQMDMRTRWTDYGRWTRFSSSTGALLSSSDYVQALRVRSLAAREVAELMAPFDAILTPAAMTTAPLLEGLTYEFYQRNRGNLTSIWNFLGLPSVSTPMGFVDGLPVGLLISGKGWQDATALKIADAYQRATDWHLRVPPIASTVAA